MKKLLCVISLLLVLSLLLVACEQARSITKSEIVNGELVLTYNDGTTENLGKVVGNDGEKGEKGEKGDKGDKGDPGTGSDYTNASGENGLNFYLLSDGNYGVYPQYAYYAENIVIPAEYNGKPVTYVGMPTATTMNDLGILYGFGTTGVKTIVLPEGITHIGVDAFYSCSELVSITIPSSVVLIDKEAFYDCDKLESVVFTNKTGWSANGVALNITDDAAANAELLTQTHCFEIWTRSDAQ